MSADEFNLVMLGFRVAVGITLALHGYFKFFKGGRIAGTARWFDSIGMKPGRIHALLAACTELGAGVLLALGLLTPFAGAGFVGLMLVAGYSVNRPNGFFSANHGWEFNFILATCGISAAMLGPGEWSVDDALGIADDLNGYTGLAIAGGIGVAAGVAQLAIFFRPPPPAPTP